MVSMRNVWVSAAIWTVVYVVLAVTISYWFLLVGVLILAAALVSAKTRPARGRHHRVSR